MEKEYDLIVVGSGPAGLTAGIYAARYNLNFLVIGKLQGGEISEAHKVCNYPSQSNITGFELSQKIVNHLIELGGKINQEEILEIKKQKEKFIIFTNKEKYFAKKIILAIGREKQILNIPGEKEFLGKGVSYCATCDAAFYKNKIVAVLGGGNAAVTAALLLAEHAEKIYIIYRKDKFFRAEPAWIKQLEKEKKIKPIFSSNVERILGKNHVESVKLDTGKKIKLDGVFVEIGSLPQETISKSLGIKTESGHIITDKNNQKTNIKGVYAAGDITNNNLKQVITACAEGAIAATTAYKELKLEE